MVNVMWLAWLNWSTRLVYNKVRCCIRLYIYFQNNGSTFNESDIALFEAFAIFCGIGIHNTKMYEGAIKMMAKQKVALDCLSYHASASVDDTESLAKAAIPTADKFSLNRYPICLIFNPLKKTLEIVTNSMTWRSLMKTLTKSPFVCSWSLAWWTSSTSLTK